MVKDARLWTWKLQSESGWGYGKFFSSESMFLYQTAKAARFNFHGNVITGIDRRYVYVNGPFADANGGMERHPIPDFVFGLYASAHGGVDCASLMKNDLLHDLKVVVSRKRNAITLQVPSVLSRCPVF